MKKDICKEGIKFMNRYINIYSKLKEENEKLKKNNIILRRNYINSKKQYYNLKQYVEDISKNYAPSSTYQLICKKILKQFKEG